MLDPFDQKKSLILKGISQTLAETPDASPKGSIDELCIPMMNLLNSHRDIVTTSSCSGRVSVFLEGSKEQSENVKIGSKGEGGKWLFVSHNENEIDNWWKDKHFKFNQDDSELLLEYNDKTRYILYKFEPFILHVKCRDLVTAQALYTTAMGCGFRESGIGSNNVVAVRISIKLDIPMGFLSEETGELVSLVSESYLKLMVKLSLDRFKENSRKIDQLYQAFEKVISEPIVEKNKVEKVETKEERRIRKMQEGMARRDGVRAEKELAKLAKLLAENEKNGEKIGE